MGLREFFDRWWHGDAPLSPVDAPEPLPAPIPGPAVFAAAPVPRVPQNVPHLKTAVARLRTSDRLNVSPTTRDPRTGRATPETLRRYAQQNAWVRVAINRRKSQIAQARWSVTRLDRPSEKADARVVKAVGDLFRYVNPKRESFRSLMDQVVEDLLVLDAGTIELEKNLAGSIVALYAVDGATIVPDPDWDGSDPNATRYRQLVDGKVVAEWRNDEMMYVMANPRTTSVRGFSPVEVLLRAIEAELYGEAYDIKMHKKAAPAGILDLGPGVPPEDVAAFRAYYEAEIAGTSDVAIFGGGDPSAKSGVKWHAMEPSAQSMQHREYMKWQAIKIASIFEIDLGLFNLTETLHRTTADRAQSLTDEGHRSLALLVQEYITREIVAQFDDNHAFVFADLNSRDEEAQSILDERALRMGIKVPNEIRARDGRAPLPFGSTYFLVGRGPWEGSSSLGARPDDEGARNPLSEPAASAPPVNENDEPGG